MPECCVQLSRTCPPDGSFHNACLLLLFCMFMSSEKMTALHGLWALMSFKTKPQIFKTAWELLPCSSQNFFPGVFLYTLEMGHTECFAEYDLFTSRKVILSDPLNSKVGTNWDLAVPSYLNVWLGALNLIPRSKLSAPKTPTSFTEVA